MAQIILDKVRKAFGPLTVVAEGLVNLTPYWRSESW